MKQSIFLTLLFALAMASTTSAEMDPQIALRLLKVEAERDQLATQLSDANRRILELEREVTTIRAQMDRVIKELTEVRQFVKMPETKDEPPVEIVEKPALPITIPTLLQRVPQQRRPNRGEPWHELHTATTNFWFDQNITGTRVEFSGTMASDGFSHLELPEQIYAVGTVTGTVSFNGRVFLVELETRFGSEHFRTLARKPLNASISLVGEVESARIIPDKDAPRPILKLKLINCTPTNLKPR